MAKVASRKCVLGCKTYLSLHLLPKKPNIRQKWVDFLFSGAQEKTPSPLVCSRHFPDIYFVNKAQFDAGFAKKLILKENAVPCLHGPNGDSEVGPLPLVDSEPEETAAEPETNIEIQEEPVRKKSVSVSQGEPVLKKSVSCGTQFKPLLISVGTQIYLPCSSKSTGTQLSLGKLKTQVRSKAVQATVMCSSVGTETIEQETDPPSQPSPQPSPQPPPQPSPQPPPSSTPPPLVSPAKRPRLELVKEEEEEEKGSFTVVLTDDVKYEPEDSFTEPSEIRQVKDTLPQEADEELHSLKPGDWIVVKDFRRKVGKSLKWLGPYQVLLTTASAVKTAERATWILASHCKKIV